MYRHFLTVGRAASAALVVVFATAGMAKAQVGAQPPDVPRGVNPYGEYPHSWRFYEYPSASVGGPLLNPPIYMTSLNFPGVYGAFIYGPGGGLFPAPGPHTTSYQASYAPVFPNDTRAHLTVMAPPTAKIWFNGTLTQQTGEFRQFVTPPLTPGEPFHYNITAKWVNNVGQQRTLNRQVTVAAGNWLNVDMLAPPAAEMQAQPMPASPALPAQTPPVPAPRERQMQSGPLPGTQPMQRTVPQP